MFDGGISWHHGRSDYLLVHTIYFGVNYLDGTSCWVYIPARGIEPKNLDTQQARLSLLRPPQGPSTTGGRSTAGLRSPALLPTPAGRQENSMGYRRKIVSCGREDGERGDARIGRPQEPAGTAARPEALGLESQRWLGREDSNLHHPH